jgi:hypothetical protein
MLAKRVATVVGPLIEVFGKSHLPTERLTGTNSAGLRALDLPDVMCGFEHLVGSPLGNKEDAVVVAKHHIIIRDNKVTDPGARQGLGLAFVQARRPERAPPVAENGEPNLDEVGIVPMEPPDIHTRDAEAFASRTTRSPMQASSVRPPLSMTSTSPGFASSKASRNTSTLP